MDDTLIPLAHGYGLVQIVIGAGRSVFMYSWRSRQAGSRWADSRRGMRLKKPWTTISCTARRRRWQAPDAPGSAGRVARPA